VNVLVMLFLMASLSFAAYTVPATRYNERGKIQALILVSLVTFKLSVENKLPKVPYATAFDRYMRVCQGIFFIIALQQCMAVVVDLSEFLAPSEVALLELLVGCTAGITWIAWNVWFARRAWVVKKLEPTVIRALPPSLERTECQGKSDLRRASFASASGRRNSQGGLARRGSVSRASRDSSMSAASKSSVHKLDLATQIEKINAKLRFKKTQTGDTKIKPPTKVVMISVKISHIGDVNPLTASFKVQFRVCLEWLDEKAVGQREGSKVEGMQIPEVNLTNAVDYSVLDQSRAAIVVCSDTGHVAYQTLYKATIQMDFDMSLFPFDSQTLLIDVGMRSRKDRDRTFCFQYCEVDSKIRLAEWIVHSTFGECDQTDRGSRTSLGVLIQRLSWYHIINVVSMLCCITTMLFCFYAIDLTLYHERTKINVSLLLSLVSFKLSVENKLPKVAYSTKFDQYSTSFWFFFYCNIHRSYRLCYVSTVQGCG
jgi:hypothetical protein